MKHLINTKNSKQTSLISHLCSVLSLSGIIFGASVLANDIAVESAVTAEAANPFEVDVVGTNYREQLNLDHEITPYSTDVLGDSIDLSTGSFSFRQTDFSIPGNFDIPVNITRVFMGTDSLSSATREFGTWSFDLPHIRTSEVAASGQLPANGIWQLGDACSGGIHQTSFASGSTNNDTVYANQSDYWNGDSFYVPGQGSLKLLASSTDGTGRKLTNHWKVSCFESPNGYEGFKVTSDTGTIYTFDMLKRVAGRPIKISIESNAGCEASNCQLPGPDVIIPDAGAMSTIPFTRYHTFMLVSNITDRFGNSVDYDYHNDGRLKNIVSSDTRRIDVAYFGTEDGFKENLVKSITAHGRTYNYNYENLGLVYDLPSVVWLKTAKRPDNKSWSFDRPALTGSALNTWKDVLIGRHALAESNFVAETCAAGINGEYMTIQHPDGLSGTFHYTEVSQKRVGVPWLPRRAYNIGGSLWVSSLHIKHCNEIYAVGRKVLNNPGGETLTWDYRYYGGNGSFTGRPNYTAPVVDEYFDLDATTLPNSHSLGSLKTTEVSLPDDSKVRHHFSALYGQYESKELVTDYLDNNSTNTILRRVYSSYEASPTDFGVSWLAHDQNSNKKIRNKKSTIEQNADNYYQEVLEFNDYDVPLKVKHWNDFDNSKVRYISYDFLHDTTKNILNLPVKTNISNQNSAYTTFSETTYHSDTLGNEEYDGKFLPYEFKRFGNWNRRHSEYHADGNVKKLEVNTPLLASGGTPEPLLDDNGAPVTEGGSAVFKNRYITLGSYKRGIAQSVTLPNRYTGTGNLSISKTVDNNGWVTQLTDLNNTVTGYGYDSLGRLHYIEAPTDTPQWLDTLYTWSDIANGQTRLMQQCVLKSDKTACEGAALYSETVTYDGLFRPILTKRTAGTESRYQNRSFDAFNQENFSSYWASEAAETKGVDSTYDGLQRLRKSTQTGLGERKYNYLAGNKQQVTDAELNVTTNTYLAFGSPAYQQLTKIESPENVTTTIAVDIYGKPLSITQAGAGDDELTEYRAYDANHFLCKISRADVGTTTLVNDVLGQVSWQAQGVTSSSGTNCDSTVANSSKVHFSYDNLGDIWQVDYATAATGEPQTPDVTYTLDGNGNVTNLLAGTVSHVYAYNKLNLLETETLTAPGFGTKSLDYHYSTLGYLSGLTYPDGDRVNYAPNSFGEPTQAIRQANTANSRDLFEYVQAGASYYPSGALNTFIYGNDFVHTTTLHEEHLLPKGIKDHFGTSKVALDYVYTYDKNQNVTKITDNVNDSYSLTSLVYDGLDRLTGTTDDNDIESSVIAYDGLGNITDYSSVGRDLRYTYDYTKNRLTSVNHVSPATEYKEFEYDDRGNVTSNGYSTLSFNRANQLVSADSDKRYLYDGHNRRVTKTNSDGSKYSFYSQSGMLLYSEEEGKGVNYIYLGKKLVAKDGVIPEGSGKQHYRPYGESIEGAKDDIGYTGHKYDEDLGLSYMQARYYDPVIGRFYSNDPVDAQAHLTKSNVHGFNRYAYANNNPYRYTDPDGKEGVDQRLNLRVKRLSTGEITRQEFSSENMAEAVGGLAATAIVATRGAAASPIAQKIKSEVKQEVASQVLSAAIEIAANQVGVEGTNPSQNDGGLNGNRKRSEESSQSISQENSATQGDNKEIRSKPQPPPKPRIRIGRR